MPAPASDPGTQTQRDREEWLQHEQRQLEETLASMEAQFRELSQQQAETTRKHEAKLAQVSRAHAEQMQEVQSELAAARDAGELRGTAAFEREEELARASAERDAAVDKAVQRVTAQLRAEHAAELAQARKEIVDTAKAGEKDRERSSSSLARELAVAKAQLEAMESAHRTQLGEAQLESQEREAANLRSVMDDNKSLVAEIVQTHAAELEAITQEKERADEEYAAELARLHQEHADYVRQVHDEHHERHRAATEAGDSHRSAAVAATERVGLLNGELEAMKEREARAMAQIQEDYEQKLADQTAQALKHATEAERLQRLLSEKEAELSETEALHGITLQQTKEQAVQQAAAAEASAARKLHEEREERETMRTSYEEKIQALRLTHAADLQTLHDERDEEMHSILELSRLHEEAAHESAHLLEQTIGERDLVEREGKETASQLEKRLKQEHAEQLSEVQEREASAVKRVREEEQHRYETELAALSAKADAERKRLEEALTEKDRAAQAAREAAKAAAHAKMQTEHASLAEQHKERVASMRKNHMADLLSMTGSPVRSPLQAGNVTAVSPVRTPTSTSMVLSTPSSATSSDNPRSQKINRQLKSLGARLSKTDAELEDIVERYGGDEQRAVAALRKELGQTEKRRLETSAKEVRSKIDRLSPKRDRRPPQQQQPPGSAASIYSGRSGGALDARTGIASSASAGSRKQTNSRKPRLDTGVGFTQRELAAEKTPPEAVPPSPATKPIDSSRNTTTTRTQAAARAAGTNEAAGVRRQRMATTLSDHNEFKQKAGWQPRGEPSTPLEQTEPERAPKPEPEPEPEPEPSARVSGASPSDDVPLDQYAREMEERMRQLEAELDADSDDDDYSK